MASPTRDVPGGFVYNGKWYRDPSRRVIHCANPTDREWRDQSFVLWFGACGPAYVLAYGSLEAALEEAASYLVDRGWLGLIEPHETFYAEAEHDENCDHDSGQCSAEIDMTYTESGWIPSWEWGIAVENPTREDLIAFARNR